MPRNPVATDYWSDHAPARCPQCNSPVRTTLRSDPLTPVYLCNSTPDRIVCAPYVAPWPDEVLDNLCELDAAEAAWVRATVLEVTTVDDR